MQRPSSKILIISTGGTFNKVYNPFDGSLEIDSNAKALREIFSQWLCEFELVTIIDKDSLDMNNNDREYLWRTVKNSVYDSIIIVHGSDTIDKSASFLASQHLDKKIVFTASMVPFSINPIEATANLALAIGYIQALNTYGVYLAINGVAGEYNTIIKDRKAGKFIQTDSQ